MINDEELKKTIYSYTAKFSIDDIAPYFMCDPGLLETKKFWTDALKNNLPKNGSFYTSETFTCFWVDHKKDIIGNKLSQRNKEIFLLIGLMELYYDEIYFSLDRYGFFFENLISLNINTLKSALSKFSETEPIEKLICYIYDKSLGENPDFNLVIENADTGLGTLIFDSYPGDARIDFSRTFFIISTHLGTPIMYNLECYPLLSQIIDTGGG